MRGMRRIKLTIEYDGTDFKGWQVQNESTRTVQGAIENALRIVCGQPVRIAGAGRTDAGVHARGQVASFAMPDDVRVPTSELCAALNGNCPGDVSVVSAEEVPEDFHAQRSATGKIYSYSVLNRREPAALLRRTHWQMRYPQDVMKLRAAAAFLVGTHDFTSFATKLAETQAQRAEDGKRELETVRTIQRIDWIQGQSGVLKMEIEGSGFLYQMVRTIVGTLVEVGRGARQPEWVADVLAAKDRRAAGPTAPPVGLCLERVFYP
jgi:tRNA pseudouridine38-40 synthase